MQSQNVQEEKEKKKKKLLILLIIFFIFLILSSAVAVCVVFALKNNDRFSGYVDVVVDPVLMEDENHLLGAEKFSLDLNNGTSEHSSTLVVNLLDEQYIRYSYTLTNKSNKKVTWTLSLENLNNSGFDLSYQIEDESESSLPESSVLSGELGISKELNFYVFFRPKAHGVSSTIAGSLVIGVTAV